MKSEISISGMELLPNGDLRVSFRFMTEHGPKDQYLQLNVLEGNLFIFDADVNVQSNLNQIA